MKRTNLCLTEPQLKDLTEIVEKTELKMAEILRRAIDEYIEKYKSKQQKLNENQ
jgi:predicted house-cleaning NTP pyrophosphatase (Maf/HAM1 superfamily)